MVFIIDPQSNSFELALQDLNSWIDSKPEVRAWIDALDSSTGQTLLQLLAGFDTSLKYNNAVNRRETYRTLATNRSAIIAGASDDGYSAFRGQNITFELTITPTTNTFIDKFESVGTLQDVELISLEQKTFTNGTQDTLKVIAGNKLSETINVNSDDLTVFRFLESSRVSEDIRVILTSPTYPSGVEVPLSKDFRDLVPLNTTPPVEASYVAITNPFDTIDLFYLNLDEPLYNHRYDTGDTLTLEYIELKNLTGFTLPTDLFINFGNIDVATVLSNLRIPEPNDSIQVNSILFNQTRFVVRGRDDFKASLKLLDPEFIDTNARDVTPAELEVTYVKETSGGTLVTLIPAEVADYEEQLARFSFFGNIPPQIIDPRQVDLELDIAIRFYPTIDSSSINDDIAEIFAYQHKSDSEITEANRDGLRQKKLEIELDLLQMEHEFENLPYVQIARITIPSTTWLGLTAYTQGKVVKPTIPNGLIFVCKVAETSGASEPDFL
jgi:hypothetical protein